MYKDDRKDFDDDDSTISLKCCCQQFINENNKN